MENYQRNYLTRDHRGPRMNPRFNADHPTPEVSSLYPILSTNGLKRRKIDFLDTDQICRPKFLATEK